MTMCKHVTVLSALCLSLSLFSAVALGGVRDYGVPYTDGSSETWSGTSHFQHASSGLQGDIEWIVFGPGQFPYGDSGYVPPSDRFTYAYQINNTGTVAVSDLFMSVNQAVGNVNSFVSSGRVEGDPATFIDFVSGTGGFVEWGFAGISSGNSSAGLAFTSLKAPMYTTGRVLNGGSDVGGISLPGPGPNVPEPSTWILLSSGLGLVVLARRFSRR